MVKYEYKTGVIGLDLCCTNQGMELRAWAANNYVKSRCKSVRRFAVVSQSFPFLKTVQHFRWKTKGCCAVVAVPPH